MDARDPHLLLPFEDTHHGDGSTRRGFLQLVGFGLTGAALSSCSRGPVQRVVPALLGGPEYVPGEAYWIATTCRGCEAGCGVLARCRDGRPIKLEGNPDHPVSAGGLCPTGQASVLPLYDSRRLDGPRGDGAPVTWGELDQEVRAALDAARASGGRVRVLTGTVASPSERAALERFVAGFPDARHVEYDGLSAAAILDAHARTHGVRAVPRLRFDRARTIASFGADFLGTWLSPVEYTAGYSAGRTLEGGAPRMSRHVQLEARLSLTGCRADERVRLAPWELSGALAGLCDVLEELAGAPRLLAGAIHSTPHAARLTLLAEELFATRGESLVVADTDDVALQVLVNHANHLLDGYGATLDLARPSRQYRGDDRAAAALASELEAGDVDVLVVRGANPAYDFGGRLPVERAGLLVACSSELDETSSRARLVCPEPHFLERWDDAEVAHGVFSLTQPTVPALRDARTLRETLARWSGDAATSDGDLLRAHWRAEILADAADDADFARQLDAALHAGFVERPVAPEAPRYDPSAVRPPADGVAPPEGRLALVLHPQAGMLDGRNAHNPWLHELPDPVSKVTWDNCASLSPATAARLGVSEGDVVRLRVADDLIVALPAHVQVGQHDGVVAAALGYGRLGTDRFANVGPEWLQSAPTVEPGGVVGVSVASLVELGGDGRRLAGRAVEVEPTGASVELAVTQDHHSLELPEHLAPAGHEVRDAVLSTSFAEWQEDPGAALHHHHAPSGDLWPEDHPMETRWGMAIDLTRCTGCSACVVACQSENNVPVVGKDEVRRHREMSWLRVDRYFQGEGDDLSVEHQPMLCQHCDHAPCEAVCPVLATVHSAEGLNQQVYNRCVGTRYCANTCPYKVRRFNWFDYPREDRLQNHSLNPDVTIRSRGVMEKCSFCVQRIQEAKSIARREGRELADGDVRPACEQSCPASAIVFGDLNDPASRVAAQSATPRAYGVLEELKVEPSVRYLARVHNGEPREADHDV